MSQLDTAQQEQSRAFRRRGVIVLALFAVLWAAVAASGLPTGPGWALRIGAVVVAGALIGLAFRPGADRVAERPRRLPDDWRRTVARTNGAMWLVIIALVVVASLAGAPQWVPVGVALLVGLHFYPLARAFDQPQYVFTATGLCVAAVAGAVVVLAGPSLEVSRLTVGLLAALTLWATSLRLALRA